MASLAPIEARLSVLSRSGPDLGTGESSEVSELSSLPEMDLIGAWRVSDVKESLS